MQMKDVFELIDKMEESSLTELTLKNEKYEIELKKTSDNQVVYTTSAPQAVAAPVANTPIAASPAVNESAPAVQESSNGFDVITSPIVGTFYRSPSPDSPPFSEIGTEIKKDQTICIIEAMKMMNELEAEFDCKIEKILVENGTMVEFGTPLFEVSK